MQSDATGTELSIRFQFQACEKIRAETDEIATGIA